MTLGYDFFDSIQNQRWLLVFGGLIHVCSILVGSEQTNFVIFIILYAIVGGLGLGMILMIPIKCSFSYFKNSKPLLTIILMTSVLISGMIGCLISTMIINKENKRPTIIVSNGKMLEKFFPAHSK